MISVTAVVGAAIFSTGCEFVSDLRNVARQIGRAQSRHAASAVQELQTRFSAVVPDLAGVLPLATLPGTVPPAKTLVLSRFHYRLKNVLTGYAVEAATTPWEVSALTLDLPDSLRATDPANVEMIALVEFEAKHLGNYGSTAHGAYAVEAKVSLLRKADLTVLAIGTVSGSPPAASISGRSIGVDAVIGFPPADESIVALIVSSYSRR